MNLYAHVTAFIVSTVVSIVPGLAYWLGMPVQEREAIQRTLQWPAGTPTRTLEVSNIRGQIRIVAEDRQDVAVTAQRSVEQRGFASGEPPATDFREQGERLLVCGDASHCGCHRDSNRDDWDDWDEDRPRVRVDFELRVPRSITLDVCGIAAHDLRVEGTTGPYTLRNVSGDITMVDVRGRGQARTVNGDIEATFAAAPDGPSGFRTVNGRIDVRMPGSLAADLRLRTLHGDLLTNFDTTPVPVQAAAGERRNGRFVYRSDRFTSVRVGAGGPALTFETVNGDIRLLKQQ